MTTVPDKTYSALGNLMLHTGTALLQSGASCSRIRITMKRFAENQNLQPHIAIGSKAVTLTLLNDQGVAVFNGDLSIPAQGVNFKVLSGVSRLSWQFTEGKFTLVEARQELERLLKLPHYPRLLTLCAVSLAGAAFCYTFGGDWLQMAIAFCATFCGLFTKQEMVKRSFNTYLVTFTAALVAASVVGVFHKAGLHANLEQAFSTCVLFLIPGVPLINSITDLIDGNTVNGIDRGVMALMHALAIAFGLAAAMFILNFRP